MANTPYINTINDDQPGGYEIQVPVFACTAIANANELTNLNIGHPFEVLGIDFVCVTPITTSGKTATIKPYISGTVVPGTATAVAGTKAKGVVTVAFQASGAKLQGSATDTLSLTCSAVTAFAEGAGYWNVRLRNLGGSPV